MAKRPKQNDSIAAARAWGWQAAYHMVMVDLDWDDTEFKAACLGSIHSKAESEAYDLAKRSYLIKQH